MRFLNNGIIDNKIISSLWRLKENNKMDCKITENYLKEKSRMSEYDAKAVICKVKCENCPLSVYNNGKNLSCNQFERMYPKEAIAIVQKWSDEHQPKTYASDFLEKFPNAERDERGVPRTCRGNIYGIGNIGYCGYDCKACWNKVMTE